MSRALLLLVAVLLVAAPAARADGDPASDYLLGQASFIPPDAGVPSGYAAQLNATLTEAKTSGFEIRVALIASRYDLGSVGVLYQQPKRYARFLGQELYFVYKGRLLVVMPNGLGVSRGGKAATPPEQRIAAQLPPPGKTGAALASTATRAVVRLAASAGVVLAVPPLTGTTTQPNENHDRIVIGLAVLAALAAFGVFVFLRVRSGGRSA